MTKRKKLTNKELHGEIMLNRQAMVNIDQYLRASTKELAEILTAYIDFKKDRKGFEKFVAKLIETSKKEAAKLAKNKENKTDTAKEESEVPVK